MNEFEEIRILFKNIFKDNELFNNIYFVGGCVRDYIRNESPKDIDIVVNKEFGSLKFVMLLHNLFKNETTIPYKLGNYPIRSISFKENVVFKNRKYNVSGLDIEVAETMTESFLNSNSRQRNVTYTDSLSDDVFRRDFSINSGLMNLNGELIKISKTFEHDIKNGIIKCNDGIDKDKIFSDDPLRCLRAATFSARFNWEIDKDTMDAIRKNAYRIKIVSVERIMKEIIKVVKIRFGLYRLILCLDKLDLLQYIFPDINNQKNVSQQPDTRRIHLEGVSIYEHTLSALKHAPNELICGLAVLFHDIGKTNEIKEEIDGKMRFSSHEKLGFIKTKKILYSLKFSNDIVNRVSHLVLHHMDFCGNEKLTDKSIRKIVRSVGEDNLEDLFRVINADCCGTIMIFEDGTLGPIFEQSDLFDRVRTLIKKDKKLEKIKNIFDGYEIMSILNINSGKDVGKAINIMYDIQDEFGYDINKAIAAEMIKKRFSESCLSN